jgi:hypothetical protein
MLPPLAFEILALLDDYGVLSTASLLAFLDVDPRDAAWVLDELVRHDAVRQIGVNDREYLVLRDYAPTDARHPRHARRDPSRTSEARGPAPRLVAGDADPAAGRAGG